MYDPNAPIDTSTLEGRVQLCALGIATVASILAEIIPAYAEHLNDITEKLNAIADPLEEKEDGR